MSDATNGIRVLADYVLVKQTMKKKKSVIITSAAKDDKEKFDFSFVIVQKGAECKRDFNIGDSPIFSQYVQFSGLKVLERDDDGMISLVVVHENDIIAIDNEPVQLKKV